MPKYLNGSVINKTHYPALLAAMREHSPAIKPLLISDRSDEIASISESTGAAINVVTKMDLQDYINPYYAANDRFRSWHGFLDRRDNSIHSLSEYARYTHGGKDIEFIDKFVLSTMDIRNFVYGIEFGEVMNTYDLFAGDLTHALSKENLTELKKFSAAMFNIQSIYSRYIGALDSITSRVMYYKAFILSRLAALNLDNGANLESIRPTSFDVPSNNEELKELFTLFISTWVRANMVTKFIIERRAAKTPEESRAVKNDLILRWWLKDSPDRFTDEEMFSFAMRNMMIKNIAVTTGVRSIRHQEFISGSNEFYPLSVPNTVSEHNDLANRLTEIIDAMVMVTNDIRARVGNVPATRNAEIKAANEIDPIKLVEKIITA